MNVAIFWREGAWVFGRFRLQFWFIQLLSSLLLRLPQRLKICITRIVPNEGLGIVQRGLRVTAKISTVSVVQRPYLLDAAPGAMR